MQDGVDIVTEVMAEYLAQNKNIPAKEALEKLFSMDTANRLLDTGLTSAGKFAKGMLIGTGIRAAGASWAVRDIQKTPEAQAARAVNERHAKIVSDKTGTAEQKDQADVVFLPASVLQEFGQSSVAVNEQTKNAADAQAPTVNQILGIEAAPAAAAPAGSSIAEQLGVDEKSAVEFTGEVMISREKYDKLAAENPEFAKATEAKVRYGAMGRTFEEQAAAVRENEADPLNDPDDPWAKEAREIRDEKIQQLKDAGYDEQTAKAGGYLMAKNMLTMATRMGTNELGVRKNDAKSPARFSEWR